MKKLEWFALGGLVLGACSAQGTQEAAAPQGDTGPEAAQAIALARSCAAGEPWGGQNGGYSLELDQASAHREGAHGSRFRVRVPEGFYLGRLPPPRPVGAIWIQVDLARKSCVPSAAP